MSVPASAPGEGLVCSARGCRAAAAYGVVWNNPSVHRPGRRKVWLACDDHRETLAGYLSVRGFLLDVLPVDRLGPEDG